MEIFDTAIIGAGIAGISAALTAKSLRMKTLWLGDGALGGKAVKAEYVRNYPAFVGSGEGFVGALEAQIKHEGLELTPCRVNGIYKNSGGFMIAAGEKTFSAKTVILATGAERAGAMKGEREFVGRGVSYCAVCDGALYRGKTVAAVLSSEEFVKEAEYLAGFAKKIYCFCPAGVKIEAENAETITDTPTAVEGAMRVQKLVCKAGEYAVDGVFFLRMTAPPETLAGGLKTDGGRVLVSRDMETNLTGLFAAGDVTGTPYQYAKAAGEGLVAAYSARAYLNGERKV